MRYVFLITFRSSDTHYCLVHRWLYLRVGILHRDLSLSNIMYRIIEEENEAGVVEEKICGVLTDFDLASWTVDLKIDRTRTSQQRTGTPPFMAHGVLRGSDALHLYRHDLESLFYIMLILATHYDIQLPTEKEDGRLRTRQGSKELPYETWFGQTPHKTLAAIKQEFLLSFEHLDLSPGFEGFRDWLWDLRLSFRRGIRARQDHEELITLQQGRGNSLEAAPEFDDETLGGRVDYSALIDPVRRMKGELEGLIIRYDPSLPTPTDDEADPNK
jgi:serine/threonine protein kinase